ncbi:hypothetical protein S245_066188 [Arachis hypogaea]
MSDYYFAELETGQQDPYSKDCGIWVAQWMMQGHIWGDYNLQVVNNATRMRLAVDLVMGRHNAKRNEVTRIAEEDWDRKMRRSAQKDSKTLGDPTSPSVSF